MKKIFLFIIIYSSVFQFVSCKKEPAQQSGYDQELLDAVNTHRLSIGLLPLENSDFLWQIAYEHSAAMADGSVPFGNDGFTERSERIRAEFGLGPTAENDAEGSGTATEIVNEWLASTGLKPNIEGDYTLTGISAVRSKNGKWYYTQIFYKVN
jgi:uncharacterized protein YkwD